jgi:hypothetical protein
MVFNIPNLYNKKKINSPLCYLSVHSQSGEAGSNQFHTKTSKFKRVPSDELHEDHLHRDIFSRYIQFTVAYIVSCMITTDMHNFLKMSIFSLLHFFTFFCSL